MTRLLVTGSTGLLGRQLVADANAAGFSVAGLARGEADPVDITDAATVADVVATVRPQVIIHGAAWTDVDACEGDPDRAWAVNAGGTAHVVAAAGAVGAHVVYVSTDYVFSGTKATPYVEADAPEPRCVYGRTKAAGEARVSEHHTIVRTSWLSGDHGPNMVATIVDRLARGDDLAMVEDQVGHPSFTADVAPALLALADQRTAGIFHVTNQRAVSWFDLAQEVAALVGADPGRVRPITTAALGDGRAPRPANSVLAGGALTAAVIAARRDHRLPLGELVERLLARRRRGVEVEATGPGEAGQGDPSALGGLDSQR